MRDQAEELRSIVLKSVRQRAQVANSAPRIAAVVGGKGGVGTTTLTVNVSVALAQLGHRVVVVDAHLGRSDVAALCRLRERYGIADVLAARRDIHEVLEPGPVGIHVLPGTWAPEDVTERSRFGHERFVQRLRTLGPYADWVILDTGSQIGPFVATLCQAADQVLLVTNPDTVSVMDAYATIKTLLQQVTIVHLRSIVNQVIDEKIAHDVHERIARSCNRFLQFAVEMGGAVPLDEHVSSAAEIGVPVMTKSPTCRAARALERLALKLNGDLVTSKHEKKHQQAAA